MREPITRAAMQLFARKGFAGTSMREIAEAASVTKAALYYHFPNKETLYREAMAATLAWLDAQVARAAEGVTDPLERLRAVVHAQLALFVDEPDLIRALYHHLLMPDPVFHPGPSNDEETCPLFRAVHDCVTAGFLEAELQRDVFTLLSGGIEYTGVRWVLDRAAPTPSAELGDRLIQAVMPKARRAPAAGRARPLRAVGWLALLSLTAHAAFASPDIVASPGGIVAIPGDTLVLGVSECVTAALDANAELRSERAGRAEVRGQMLQAASNALPSIDLVGGFTRSRDPSFALDETFGGGESLPDSLAFFVVSPGDVPPQTFWRASVDATWELNPGKIVNAIGGARIGIDRQETLILAAEHRIVEQTLIAYYDVVRAAEQVESIAADVAARREFLDITKRRHRLDFATALDTLQAAVALANVRPQARRAAQDLVNAGTALNVLMGRAPETPVTIDGDVTIETHPVPMESALDIARTRPGVRQLELLTRMHGKNRGALKSDARPYLSLSGSYGYVAREFDELGDDDKDTWRTSVMLTLPLFDGLLTRGRVKESEATIRRTRELTEDALRRAHLDVRRLVGELEVARTNLVAAELNVTRAQDALRITTLTYENGKADYLSVLNAQADRSEARKNLIDARHDVLARTASLKRAMGVSPTEPLAAVFKGVDDAG